jgi:phosphotransferase system enzyme I (PtsP)
MDKDHLNLLCSVNELSAIVAGSSDICSLMEKLVDTICQHIHADVCSIYLYDEQSETLSMKSTRGLNREQADQVSLKLGEGLVGECLRMRRPICETKASSNPKFRYFDELDEDKYEAFLAVPIIRGLERIGVLVLQRQEEDSFNESDILALQATASMLANVIENIRITLSLTGDCQKPEVIHDHMELISGIVASPGIGFSTLELLDRNADDWRLIPGGEDRIISAEDFEKAIAKTTKELELLESKLEAELPEMASMIFGAHVMMLKDP